MQRSLLFILLIAAFIHARTQETKPGAFTLWYDKPAAKWTEALPIGNGRLGAMIFGDATQERLQFNEETLWTGGPRNYHRAGASQYLEQIRTLLREGKQKEAEALAAEKFMGMMSNEGKKADWVKQVKALKGMHGNPALPGFDDSKWKTFTVPTYEGWETEGLEVDGAVWFRTTFELPAAWNGKNLVLDLNRIRDHDITYVNGKMAGSMEGTGARRYVIPKEMLRPGTNVIAVQVLNYFDKGGIAGYKDTSRHIGLYPEGENGSNNISLVKKWKYFVQDDEPPAVPRFQADYQPFGDLKISFHHTGTVQNYRRELDLQKAVARTSYTVNNIQYSREYLSSQPHQAITVHLSASKRGSISFEAMLSAPHKHAAVTRIDNNTLSLSLKVRNGVLKGSSILRAVAKGGSIKTSNNRIVVEGADEVTLYLTAATSYKNYKDVSAEPYAISLKAMQLLKGKSWTDIKNAHVREYQSYFNTFSIDLGHSPNEQLSTDKRIEQFAAGSDPSLVSLFMQYGRYLLIASSRPGTRPANLQGIWNDLLTPPWGSKYTTNINAEMNYWPAELLNLSPMHEPLFGMIEELAQTGRQTAKAHYNARGWVLHHNTDLWRGTAPINASNHGIWVTGGAWLCQHLWERFRFTGDTAFLKQKAFPLMRDAALFFTDFLVIDQKTGWLISTPSNSPENGGLVAGPAMDHQIIRELFKNTIEAARLLKINDPFIQTVKEKLSKLAPDQIGKFGQLQEWLEDKDDTTNKHRHISHLWAVHPGGGINWIETPELMRAARQSLLYRGDAGTGWSLAWKINFWARFKDGDHAYKMIRMLIHPAAKGGGAYPNLFDAHPPFQIDGNFGGAAGIAEMLVQSHTNAIDLLPALPSSLPQGRVKGICARGGFILNMEWGGGKLQSVEVFSKTDNACTLRYGQQQITIHTQKGKWQRFDGNLKNIEQEPRVQVSLDKGWLTIANDSNIHAYDGFEKPSFNDAGWKQVDVPHNWDAYEGYRRMRHGNRHGYAWYRKTFEVQQAQAGKQYFLFFEGVGSYATVWLNGKKAGYHAGGRTSFTLNVTGLIHLDKPNVLAVRADHPAGIKDLPWVCGGCSDERGFSEGSQPMGIFRPVALVATDFVRIEPFGVHAWCDSTTNERTAGIFIDTEIKNYDHSGGPITLVTTLVDKNNKTVASASRQLSLQGGLTTNVRQRMQVDNPHLWSVEDPYLYTIISEIKINGEVTDRITTPYGIRWISWPVGRTGTDNRFLLNGKPVFINGVAEYEHLLGNSHAFTAEQVHTRVTQMKSAGFNAFRDAHQPHNLRYGRYWDELGFLWWTQISAHVWYDSPEFRKNFKQLLVEWVKERRNSPSVVLWGLQNESKLPEDFARECMELIRQLDPTASAQRKVVTCNGGKGTDWDVPQNWTGTYGGNPAAYGEDLKRQVLVGEYGAWRTLDLHTEGPFQQNGVYSEDRMTQLMEMKVRLAEAVKDSTAGHFMWLLTSHDNPGRVQGGEGYRELDRIGPVNYKGLLTPWEEPLDVFYMYRSNFAPKDKEPMVYIVSHTWPGRWTSPGIKDSLVVYSNCDEVELFNDVEAYSLGRRKKNGIGTHFQWDKANIQFNILYAIGYVNGRAVAKDTIVLYNLPVAPGFQKLLAGAKPVTRPEPGYHYIYRLNCGGGQYTDAQGNEWMADRRQAGANTFGSASWTNQFPGMPAFFASQRMSYDPVKGTADWKLFQDFRFGREQLKFNFPVPDGEYLVELYFTEPWLGTGGGMNCTGWRMFDVAVNGITVLKDLDIWKEAGHDSILKKTVKASIRGGQLTVSFPRITSGQAIISAIAIASTNSSIQAAPAAPPLIEETPAGWNLREWMNTGDNQYADAPHTFITLPSNLHGATWVQMPAVVSNTAMPESLKVSQDADVFIGLHASIRRPAWMADYEDTKTSITNSKGDKFSVYRKRYIKGAQVVLGKNGEDATVNAMYVVAAIPVSHMEPAYDLKPVTSYKAVNARFKGPGISKGMVEGKERVIFTKASAENVLEWDFTVGVADTYSLTITYNSPQAAPIPAKVELFSADGTLMRAEQVEFTSTRPGKNNYINSSTGSMINAGHYIVRITSPGAVNVSLNALDVQ